jgi:hypothetical protein
VTQPSRWDVRVAVIYQDRVTFLQSRNTWREVVVTVQGEPDRDYFHEASAVAKALLNPPHVEGLTVIGGCVTGCGHRHWEEAKEPSNGDTPQT